MIHPIIGILAGLGALACIALLVYSYSVPDYIVKYWHPDDNGEGCQWVFDRTPSGLELAKELARDLRDNGYQAWIV